MLFMQIVASSDQCKTIITNKDEDVDSRVRSQTRDDGASLQLPPRDDLSFRILVCFGFDLVFYPN